MTQAATLDFDHVELLIGAVENAADANAKAVRNTVLSPRFYTTDFDAMDKLNIESVRAEWDTMMKEYEGDNNHDHFQRDAAFADEVRELMPQLSPEMRQEFLDFLISSLTSEFSGCILYNEVRKHVKNPDIKQLMTFMARDESRHAGFINQSLRDFDLGIDLGQLKRHLPVRKNRLCALHHYLSPAGKTPRQTLSPDLSLVRALVQRRIPPRRIVCIDHAGQPRFVARCQFAVDPLFHIGGVRHHVCA
jgi:hypothetical protein